MTKCVWALVSIATLLSLAATSMQQYHFGKKLQYAKEYSKQIERQANLLHESDMLVAPPYWTVVTESIDGYSLIPPSGSFDTATEVFVPREIFTKFWDNGEFQSGVVGKKIKFHYKERHFDASLARNEWEVLKPEIVK